MKILLATDGDTLQSKIAKRFGHAPYYLIFDSETSSLDVRINHGHDDNHAELDSFLNEGILQFIVGNIGPHAFKVLERRGAVVYLARKSTASDALDNFINKKLERLTEPTLKRSIEEH